MVVRNSEECENKSGGKRLEKINLKERKGKKNEGTGIKNNLSE